MCVCVLSDAFFLVLRAHLMYVFEKERNRGRRFKCLCMFVWVALGEGASKGGREEGGPVCRWIRLCVFLYDVCVFKVNTLLPHRLI